MKAFCLTSGFSVVRSVASSAAGSALAVALLSSCTFSESKVAPSMSLERLSSAPLSYQTVNEVVFRASCTDCHGGSGGVNLETYAGVVRNLERSYIRAVTLKTMPGAPRAPLTDCQAKLLELWKNSGAPETGTRPVGRIAECQGGAPPEPPPPPPPEPRIDYATVRARVFARNCIGCHGFEGGVSFETYADAKSNALGAYREAVQDRTMPPRRSTTSRLDTCQAALLRLWIEAGTPETNTSPLPEIPECANPTILPPPAPPPVPPPAPEEPQATFEYFVEKVYPVSCASCHDPGGRADDVVLTSLSSMIAEGIVRPGDGAGSLLHQVVVKEGRGQMPPASSGKPRLTPAQADALKRWIDGLSF